MNKVLSFLLFILSSHMAISQIAVKSALSFFNNATLRKELYDNSTRFDTWLSIAIAYEFSIRGNGLVVLPAAGVSVAAGNDKGGAGYESTRFTAGFFVRLYPFNAGGDCGCPDFSVRSKFFEKHFFIFVDFSAGYNHKSLNRGTGYYSFYNFDFKTGAGLGMSVPLAEKMVADIAAGYSVLAGDDWAGELLTGGEGRRYTVPSWDAGLIFRYFFQ